MTDGLALVWRPLPDARDVQPIDRVSFAVADRDDETRRVDAAAGCEFVADGIRFESDP